VHKAELEVREGEKFVDALYRSLLPDNVDVPVSARKKIELRTSLEKGVLKVVVYCKDKVETLLSTLDDILRCAQAVEKVHKLTQHRPQRNHPT